MPYSMTGFASATSTTTAFELTWEIRSVNHRFLDIGMRMPEDYRRLEASCREQLAKKINRGKVDCSLRVSLAEGNRATARIDRDALQDVRILEEQVRESFPNAPALTMGEILRFNGVICEPERPSNLEDEVIFKALDAAVDDLKSARRTEGDRIAAFLGERIASVEAGVKAASPLLAESEQRYRNKLFERIERLETEAQRERLEQELVFIAQRMDIAEEIDRLSGHADEMKNIIKRDEPIGRRLDFLMQELNREANTMSSKSQDEQLTKICVDLKVVIEQMREQVQNLE